MNPTPQTPSPSHATARVPLAMVRYSLPELLAELQLERQSGGFGMEKLQQEEIGKLFTQAKRRRPNTP